MHGGGRSSDTGAIGHCSYADEATAHAGAGRDVPGSGHRRPRLRPLGAWNELAGYAGRYVELEIPDLQSPNNNPWTSCNLRKLKGWTAPWLSYAFYGYHTPGQREGFWILEVDGSRLVIEALWTTDAPEAVMAELQQVLDSIEIHP